MSHVHLPEEKLQLKSENPLITHLTGLNIVLLHKFCSHVSHLHEQENNTGRETLFVQEGNFPANQLSQVEVFGHHTCCKGHRHSFLDHILHTHNDQSLMSTLRD